jgi:hypothetical protein
VGWGGVGWGGDMIYFSNKKYREEVVTSAILLIRLQKPKNNILFFFFLFLLQNTDFVVRLGLKSYSMFPSVFLVSLYLYFSAVLWSLPSSHLLDMLK